ncbi:MAG: 1-pyrroline-5-carboxylate dehydrogenase [Acidobacteria bacterium]|nr:1-pyrroline-5-carboxylate dehydrogenase [Acidobacteriota bacterium]
MTDPKPEMKITYATMSADQMETLHRGIDDAIEQIKSQLGKTYPMYIDGEAIESAEQFDDLSPIDTRTVLARFQTGTADHVRDAVRAARAAAPAWSARPWTERVAIVRKIGDGIRTHRWELAAWMGYETGKNRLECVGDIEEAADFMTYYCDQLEAHDGFSQTMDKLSDSEENTSVMRPHGVWAVISPFNFPMALAAGPAGGALVAGNTVVLKPATDTPRLGVRLYDIIAEAGVPSGVFNVVTGPGSTVGQEIAENPGIDGIVFTGSKEVGMMLFRVNGARPAPRPVITEMGGKNPAIVMPSADLDRASEGVWRSAFGAQGQKCSACSRVYVASEVRDRFVEQLVEKTKQIKVGNPLERDVWMGPVINEAAVKIYEQAIEEAKRDGGRILTGGRRMTEEPFRHGYFLEPTVIDGLPNDHRLFVDELFVPITVVGEVGSFDQAMALANDTEYGLTAGIFTEDDDEIARFFDGIEAGVVYANRQAGATTGAWPGINPFGGWKASGSSGRGAGGPYYVQQFLREQSRVRIY